MALPKSYIVELLRAAGIGIDADDSVNLYMENGKWMISWTTTERSTFQASNGIQVLKRKD